MGPLLFLAFINDLPDAVSSPVKLFADDCLIFRLIKSVGNTTILQQDIFALESWERDWQMTFHPKKCTTIHITKKKRPVKVDYLLHSHTLESIPGGKYLGVYISQDVSWCHHINQTTAKAYRSVGFLRCNLRKSVPGGKYLGVYISQDVSWCHHVNQTTAKAYRSVGFLRRNLRKSVPGGKYLGVYISQDVSWCHHINQTTAKAYRSVGFLRRNLRSCQQDVKAQAFTTLARPFLEYALSVWDPYHQQQI
jgi:drug/metabolite transporter superfamily protein YnfA